jgi:periplasmic copper chaperone A
MIARRPQNIHSEIKLYNLVMKKLLVLFLAAASMAAFAADDAKIGAITIAKPWARVTPAVVKNSAAYMTFNNAGAADKLIAVSGDVAQEIQIHSMVTEDGVMKMREVNAVDIPANGKAELTPGGFHIMLIGLKGALKDGQKFPLKLKFEKAGEVTVEVKAGAPVAQGNAEHKH